MAVVAEGTEMQLPHVDGVTHTTVTARGIRFHVAEAGSGDPMLLLHGWPQHWFCWRKVIPRLAEERRVICPDLRGFGWSDAPPSGYLKQTLAEDVLAILDELELERVDLIAHDWGAWIGFLIGLEQPERIARYLALNMYPPWAEPPSPRAVLGIWRLWYQAALATPGFGPGLMRRTDFVDRVITAGAVHREAWTPPELKVFSSVLRQPARAHASMQLYRSFLLHELRPYAGRQYRGRRLRVPTLLLHGTKDLAVDYRRLGEWELWADEMAVELTGESGHFIAEELPGLVAERALALFAGMPPAELASAA